MVQQNTFKLNGKEIEEIIRKELEARGFTIINNELDFEKSGNPILLEELTCIFTTPEEDKGENYSFLKKEKNSDELAREKLLETSLNDLDISVGLHSCLKLMKLSTLGEVFKKYDTEGISIFLKERTMSKKNLDELETLLREKKLIR